MFIVKDGSVLNKMIRIYQPDKLDWMAFPITKANVLTYHHINEKHSGGDATIANGTLLTKKAHAKLNRLLILNPGLYEEYQYWFSIINDLQRPPEEEIMDIMRNLKKRLAMSLYPATARNTRGQDRLRLVKMP